ncbi:MAG: CamS family sex pheromone protein [Turicibacter sp.]|nr:CamS family sex pheromone protein [Turicibacter sp.]
MKKFLIGWGLLFLTACATPPLPNVDAEPDYADSLPQQLMSNDFTDGYYRTILPIVSSPARGLIYSHIGGRRGNSFDISELELSLMRNSQRFFDPSGVFFQEGQTLSRTMVSNIIGRQLTGLQQETADMLDELVGNFGQSFASLRSNRADLNEQTNPIQARLDQQPGNSSRFGQNPASPSRISGNLVEGEEQAFITIGDVQFPSDEVVYLAFMVEQNFVSVNDAGEPQLEGISLGLALNPFQVIEDTNWGTVTTRRVPDEELLTIGREMANNILAIVRQDFDADGRAFIQEEEPFRTTFLHQAVDVPVAIGLYILESSDTVVPGRMAEIGLASRSGTEIRSWDTVREAHLMLHDSRILEYDANLMTEYNHFYSRIARYYPHFHGIVGTAFFMDDRLHQLEITINIDFLGLAEQLSMHQLVGSLVGEVFSSRYDVRVVLRNSREIYGVVTRQPNQDVFIHRVSW